jgi:hypothetical protein
MLEVAADAEAFGVNVQGSFGGAGVLIAEAHSAVNPITNGLDARPSRRNCAKNFQGDDGEAVDFAVAAVVEIAHDIVGQVLHRDFAGVRIDFIGQAGIGDQR